MEDPDGPVGSGIIHTLCCSINGCEFLMSDPHYDVKDENDCESCICQDCVLRLYIETNHYEDIWKLTIGHRYLYQLSALTDMIGPRDNYLIFKKVINNKRSFKKFFRYNCQRLINFRCGTPIFSYLMQRLEAIKCIYHILTRMKDINVKKWIVQNDKNMQYIDAILRIFFDRTYENVEPFDFHFIFLYKNVDSLILYRCLKYVNLDEEMIEKYKTEYAVKDFNKFTKDINKGWRKALVARRRQSREFSIQCGNRACHTSYAKHKYGMETVEFIKGKMKTVIVHKWHICKGCKCVYYCSRKCQKIAWNRQGHKAVCEKL